jgi:hypothetical protein
MSSALVGLIGARVYHLLVHAPAYMRQRSVSALWDRSGGGFSVFGLAKLCASRRQHLDASARWLGVPMNVIGKECLHDSEADLSAAYGKVIAVADGCVNCAAAAKASVPHRRPARPGPQRSLRSEAESSGVPALPNVKTARCKHGRGLKRVSARIAHCTGCGSKAANSSGPQSRLL